MLAPPYPTNSLNNRLDDLLRELDVLISERPDDERRTISNQYVAEWAKRDLSAVLGCLDCKWQKLFSRNELKLIRSSQAKHTL